jgi:hypothetical protein
MNKWGVKTKKNEKNSSTLGRREGLTTKKNKKKEESFFSLAPSLKEQVEKTHASKSMIQNKGFEWRFKHQKQNKLREKKRGDWWQ